MMDYYYSDSDYYENNPNENVPFLWCATKTTEDYGMIFWGKCDEKSCFPQEISTTMIPTISSTTTSTTSIPIVTTTTMTSKPTTSVSGEGQNPPRNSVKTTILKLAIRLQQLPQTLYQPQGQQPPQQQQPLQ